MQLSQQLTTFHLNSPEVNKEIKKKASCLRLPFWVKVSRCTAVVWSFEVHFPKIRYILKKSMKR